MNKIKMHQLSLYTIYKKRRIQGQQALVAVQYHPMASHPALLKPVAPAH